MQTILPMQCLTITCIYNAETLTLLVNKTFSGKQNHSSIAHNSGIVLQSIFLGLNFYVCNKTKFKLKTVWNWNVDVTNCRYMYCALVLKQNSSCF